MLDSLLAFIGGVYTRDDSVFRQDQNVFEDEYEYEYDMDMYGRCKEATCR